MLLDTCFMSFSNRGINLEFSLISQIHNLSYYLVIEIFCCCLLFVCFYPNDGFPSGSADKKTCLPMQEMQEMQVGSLGWKDPLEKVIATCSSILAWKIPWTELPSGL